MIRIRFRFRHGSSVVAAALVATTLAMLPAHGQDDSLHETIVSGLRWYFHWQKPLPSTKQFRCRASVFAENAFAYCDPGVETFDLTIGKAGDYGIGVILTTDEESAAAMRDHQKGPAKANYLIPVYAQDLAAYDVDPDVSKQWMKVTTSFMADTLQFYEKRGHHVRCLFPLVSRTDPFYEVYLVEGNRVDSVWLFQVNGKTLDDHPHWTYDIPHHNIPETAESHVADPTRWLATLPVSSGK
jgi:hypothetical protein